MKQTMKKQKEHLENILETLWNQMMKAPEEEMDYYGKQIEKYARKYHQITNKWYHRQHICREVTSE